MTALRNVHLTLLVVLGGTVLVALFTEVRVIENVLKGRIKTLSTINFQGDDHFTQSSTSASTSTHESQPYLPASSERYVRDHSLQLGYDNAKAPVNTCTIWTDDTNVTVPTSLHNDLVSFREELKEYNRLVRDFQPISDLRLQLAPDNSNIDQVCRQVAMDIEAIFPSRQLSRGSSGLMEPLLPPFRHGDYCYKQRRIAGLVISRARLWSHVSQAQAHQSHGAGRHGCEFGFSCRKNVSGRVPDGTLPEVWLYVRPHLCVRSHS
jgi:hypothetical protein